MKEKKPITLEEHIKQERFVAQNLFSNEISSDFDFEKANFFFQKNKNTDNNVLIFSFLYGDKAAESLGF